MSALCWKTESGDHFGKFAMGDEIGADGFRLISQLSLALDFLWRPVGNSNQRLVHCAFFAPYARARPARGHQGRVDGQGVPPTGARRA